MNEKFNIKKWDLYELYWKKGLSTDAIAGVYGCNHVTILNKMKKYEIERRTRLGLRRSIVIPHEVITELYQKQKLSETKTAEKLGCSRHSIETRMHLYGIKPRSYREANTKYPKSDFSGDLVEKAYLIGFRLGDLSVDKRKYLIHVGCSTTIEA